MTRTPRLCYECSGGISSTPAHLGSPYAGRQTRGSQLTRSASALCEFVHLLIKERQRSGVQGLTVWWWLAVDPPVILKWNRARASSVGTKNANRHLGVVK